MNTQEAIAGLNKILSLEYASMLQYLQHSYLVQGEERKYLSDFFREHAKDAFSEHTRMLGNKIVALGGVPTVEPGTIRQATTITEMFEQALTAEHAAQDAQKELLEKVQDDVSLRVMLENMILDEQEEIEELEKLLAQKQLAITEKETRLEKTA